MSVRQQTKYLAIIGLIAAALLLLAACGGSNDPDEGSSDLSGSIDIDGSSTVFPVTQAVAEEFNIVNPGVDLTVGFSGTGGGFKKFCAGDTQVSDASRPIKDSEVEACAEAGIEWTEVSVAIDGLSVAVSTENDWATCLTVDQLNAMWEPSSTVSRWSDLDPAWPDEAIEFYSPGTDSGTFDYFTEVINGESGVIRTESVTFSEDDNVLVVGVEGDKHAIGYFGYAYYIENIDRVKILQVDGGDGCVEPNEETVQSNNYKPLSRPLFIYVNNQSLKDDPQVAAFTEYYLTDGLFVIPEVGYVLFPESVYEQGLKDLEAIVNG